MHKELKKRIINEMVSTNEDRLIFQIIKEYPNFSEKQVRKQYIKVVKDKCDSCDRKECSHKYKPYINDKSEMDCYEHVSYFTK